MITGQITLRIRKGNFAQTSYIWMSHQNRSIVTSPVITTIPGWQALTKLEQVNLKTTGRGPKIEAKATISG